MASVTPTLSDVVRENRESDAYKAISKERKPWYNRFGDSVVHIDSDEETYGDWIDNYLTLYRSVNDRRVIGFKLKDVAALRDEFLCDIATVAWSYTPDTGDGLQIHYLLFAAWSRTKNEADAPKADPIKVDTAYKSVLARVTKSELVETA